MNCRTAILGSKRAFTLLEVMMAAAIMLAGVVGMIQVITLGSRMLDVSRKQTIAMQIMHGQVDTIRFSSWSQVSSLPWSANLPIPSTFQAIAQNFSLNRTVSYIRYDMIGVTFTVTWIGNTGLSYSRSSTTYVGKNGLYVTYQRS